MNVPFDHENLPTFASGLAAKVAMYVIPKPILVRVLDGLMRKIAQRHPRLLKNLQRLPAASVRIEPLDVPYVFCLSFGSFIDGMPEKGVGHEVVSLRILEGGALDLSCDAVIKGRLEVLLAMLEGREDGDTAFFSRDLMVTGDTSVIVGLRNTLDREEVDMRREVLALWGPFEKPAEKALQWAGVLLGAAARHVKAARARNHEQRRTS